MRVICLVDDRKGLDTTDLMRYGALLRLDIQFKLIDLLVATCRAGDRTNDTQGTTVRHSMTRKLSINAKSLLAIGILTTAAFLSGCEVDNFFDPSKTGRFEPTPTTIPILERIDVIEQQPDPWAVATSVTAEDLLPSDLEYRLASGDYITVEVLDLVAPNELTTAQRRIEANGTFRLPVIGDIPAAGLTAQEFQDELYRIIHETVVQNPVVNVVVEDGGAFYYTLYGEIGASGIYALRRADFHLLDAIAQAGGVPAPTQKIYIIRELALSSDVLFEPARQGEDTTVPPAQQAPVDVDSLIEQLPSGGGGGGVNPGFLSQDAQPIVDIDQLEPARISDRPVIDIEDLSSKRKSISWNNASDVDSFIYDRQRQEWIRVRSTAKGTVSQVQDNAANELVLERIIEIPYQKLKQGDSSYNIVIRPGDRIYVKEPLQGFVYIDGEVVRAGAYSLPTIGQLTLSRLIASAGGLRPLAVPERVDLTRIVGPGIEATIRVNLAAIRNRTEPDFILKPDDQIIIGTNWLATPLAVFRNGFRMSYGFGFLLDRNFGNDVFGAPPFSRINGL